MSKNLSEEPKFKHKLKSLSEQSKFLYYRLTGKRPLLKDSIGVFSSAWFHKQYNTSNVVLIGHPAAFCSSLKIKNWSFDFNNFLEQPQLLNHYLEPYKAEIQKYALLSDQGILICNCVHHTIKKYQNQYPGWIEVGHEDLSRNPMAEYKSLYQQLNLEFTETTRKAIIRSSGPQNPTEQKRKNEFVRDSRN